MSSLHAPLMAVVASEHTIWMQMLSNDETGNDSPFYFYFFSWGDAGGGGCSNLIFGPLTHVL
jgi:hypothetical protein